MRRIHRGFLTEENLKQVIVTVFGEGALVEDANLTVRAQVGDFNLRVLLMDKGYINLSLEHMPTPASHESVRLTLEQFCAIYRLPITIGKTLSGGYHASLRDVEVLNNGLVQSAVGFGPTEANALTALAAALSGNKLRIRPTGTETVEHYLKYGN